MNSEEAQKLAEVFATADGGCVSCVSAICNEASGAELGFTWRLDKDLGQYPGTVVVTADQSPELERMR